MVTWIRKKVVLVYHSLQLVEHGGADGVRDEKILESTLTLPQNISRYTSESPSFCRLAAAYAFGITKNHPFIDGNKRTAMVVSFTFLAMNGLEMTATQEEAYFVIYDLAAGQVTEDQLTAWFEDHTAPARE